MIVFLATLLMVTLPLRAAHAKTLTIAVIDTGIDKALPHLCKFGHRSFVEELSAPLNDTNGHGTHVAGIINQVAGDGDYCLVAIKYYSATKTGTQNLEALLKAIRYAIDINVNVINLSSGGPERNAEESSLIDEALSKNIAIVVAAGNEHNDLDKDCNYFPACYDKRIISVGNLEVLDEKANMAVSGSVKTLEKFKADGGAFRTEVSPTSNYGNRVTTWEIGSGILSTMPNGGVGYMSGTSQATAVFTGRLIKATLSH